MSIPLIAFYFFVLIAVFAVVALLFIRNVFYGALLLITCLLSLAGLYVLTFAEFVAVTQILVYAGGIVVVILFGVMLTTKLGGKPLTVNHGNTFAGIATGLLFFGLLVYAFNGVNFPMHNNPASETQYTPMQTVGIALMSDFVLPFEVAGVLLLLALVGAAVIASHTKSTPR